MALEWLRKLISSPQRQPAAIAPSIFEPEDPVLDDAAGNWLTGRDKGQLDDEVLSRLPPNERVAREGSWTTLNSSNVEAIRYLWEDQTLEVEFKSHRFYQFYRVPAEVFYAFLNADSPGRFVWNFIRDVYDYGRLGVSEPVKTRSGPRNRNVVRIRRDLEEGLEKKRSIIPGRPNTTPAIHPDTGRWSVKTL